MGKQLTIKEAKLVKGIVAGKTKRQAAIDAGYSPNTASEIAYETLNKPQLQALLHKELEKQGITLETVVKPVADGLKAEKVSIVGNGDSAMAEITPDHNVRLKSSQIASKWMGLDTQPETPVGAQFIQIINEKGSKYNV